MAVTNNIQASEVIILLTARRRGSHELADVFEPKTWLVEIKYKDSARKPNAPVTSAESRGNRKQAAMSASARSIGSVG